MKYSKTDIQVDGCRVLVKQEPGNLLSNWVCIAEFHHHPGVALNPSEQARKYAKTISA